MKSLRIITLCLSLFLPAFHELHGQDPAAGRIVVLPLSSNGIDSGYLQTAESILRTEISKLSSMDIVSVKRTREALGGATCMESECALEVGKKLSATKVLGCQLSALGEKIIVQYFLVDVPTSREVLVDQSSTTNIEDLDVMMKRLAKSVVDLEPISGNAEVGKILASESTEPPRRSSRRNFGLSFGYLYPQYGYNSLSRSFVLDGRFDNELQNFAVGLLLGVREGFAANIYGSYLMTNTDFCPYIGAAVGFHWISHDDYYGSYTPNMRGDGIEVGVHAGIRMLHTYNFQIVLNVDYIATMNDYNDRSVVLTIGFL